MTRSGRPAADRRAAGADDATLTAAMLRIGASLDLDAVLREAVDSARSLTGARLGVIVAVDETGVPAGFVFSGFTPDEERDLLAWSGHARLFEYFREHGAPLRLADLAGYVSGLGLAPPQMFSRAFQSTPMRHRGADFGHFFLAEKNDRAEFTDDDEAMLMVFASQAATAIANARAYYSERRARANLEALVETSPVGVVVLDAGSGRPLSFNREARRIVESLRTPGHPAEELLGVVTCRRADGREVSLAELPLEQLFAEPETVRAEEVVLSVPDGRSVRTLVNLTPVQAEGAASGSVVVTLQDLAPLDEIERRRTEFLSLVSHELRAPLTAIKGSAATLLEEAASLDPVETREFARIVVEKANQMRGLISDLLDAGRIDAGTLTVAPEPTAVVDLVERARTTFAGGAGRQGIVVDLPAGLPPVLADRRRIAQVFDNLFANAARHAPESSNIRVAAVGEATHVSISVCDDGHGVAAELLPHLFRKHGAGAAGHGLGLAICKGLVEAHGGRIRAASDGIGRGTTITFTLPTASGMAVDDGRPVSLRPGNQPQARRILVVDDDPHTLRFVREALARADFEPIVVAAANNLGHILRRQRPRLVLLDLMLPGSDGIELMRQVPELADVPVILISGYGRDETLARAFEAGAADYLVKPFSRTELVARVRAALRRHEDPDPFQLGDLAIRYEKREVTVGGRPVDLTATEFELLRVLSLNAGRVVRYGKLLRQVWRGRSKADKNLVRIFVKQVRDKLGDRAADPVWIFNERGVGYRMPKPGEN